MPLCSICRRERRLVNDHCHRTGLSRSRICATCNSGLGMFADSIVTLRRAIRYLRYHQQRTRSVADLDKQDRDAKRLIARERKHAAFLLSRIG